MVWPAMELIHFFRGLVRWYAPLGIVKGFGCDYSHRHTGDKFHIKIDLSLLLESISDDKEKAPWTMLDEFSLKHPDQENLCNQLDQFNRRIIRYQCFFSNYLLLRTSFSCASVWIHQLPGWNCTTVLAGYHHSFFWVDVTHPWRYHRESSVWLGRESLPRVPVRIWKANWFSLFLSYQYFNILLDLA